MEGNEFFVDEWGNMNYTASKEEMEMKRIFAIILLISMLLTLAGCSGLEKNPTQPTTKPTIQTQPDATKPGYVAKNKLSNPNATETTQKLYDYLCSLRGKGCLIGQQDNPDATNPDSLMDQISQATGKMPAIRGFDYQNSDFGGVNELATQWWNDGGIVAITWHMDTYFQGGKNEAMVDQIANWDDVLTPGTDTHNAFVGGMDQAAMALLQLQEAGVTVIWQPFYQFDNNTFWWGKGGPKNFVKLWQLMYDRYTGHWGLNNLIWVLPYSDHGIACNQWYPGEEYCDILGAASADGSVQKQMVQILRSVSDTKPTCLYACHENPDPKELAATPWAWFTVSDIQENSIENLRQLYSSKYTVTRDELPGFIGK